ncbi:MucR family transcriptional regulator [Acidimangrovimonas pyrenivorans]|uniref:MucR family transcriptional regulator n=1 Tax=Acidimangrovimonas pyrenivorans TaxID=2030798 RepID=A0ABV7AMK2_9RHOB
MAKTKSGDALDAISIIAAAYAARPDVSIDDIVTLVSRLSAELAVEAEPRALATATPPASAIEAQPRPALPIEQAVTRDKVYCLCCGKGFKMLKRHLGSEHGLNEDEYRALFGLPEDMPLVAPSYSERKAAYAKQVGLGKYSRDEGEDSRPPAEAGIG